VSLREAETKMQVAAAQARADQAGPLAQAQAQQEVVRKQTELAQLEADRKEKELLSSTVKPAAADAQAVIARAEGEKRARIASAEADAETTRLEGGAEAQIVLTKGEAEAKALAMRADAYKQFNEAAIIQTVLAALPEIVRAAAEPMSHIDSLTVMSADGASDIVRNATRAMVESTTAIKGLTGLDVPALVSNAIGRGVKPPDNGTQETSSDRIAEIAREGLTTMPKHTEEAKAEVKADVADVTSTARAAVDDVKQTAAAAKAATASAKQAANAVAASAQKAAVAVEAAVHPSAGTVAQWKTWTAEQLLRVPDIRLYGPMKLNDLATRGPAAARQVWQTAREALAQDYGNTTIDDLLAEWQGTTSN